MITERKLLSTAKSLLQQENFSSPEELTSFYDKLISFLDLVGVIAPRTYLATTYAQNWHIVTSRSYREKEVQKLERRLSEVEAELNKMKLTQMVG